MNLVSSAFANNVARERLRALEDKVRLMLPDADDVQVTIAVDQPGGAPYKLQVRKGGSVTWSPLSPDNMVLVCKVIGSRLGIGVKP